MAKGANVPRSVTTLALKVNPVSVPSLLTPSHRFSVAAWVLSKPPSSASRSALGAGSAASARAGPRKNTTTGRNSHRIRDASRQDVGERMGVEYTIVPV